MKFFEKQAGLSEWVDDRKEDWKNLKYVLNHKYYVGQGMRALDLPWSQAIAHDLSKLSPAEFRPYSEFWWGERGIRGSKDPGIMKQFKDAVRHHYKHNPHHYTQNNKPEDNKLKYRLERVADFYGASKATSENPSKFPEFKDWYLGKNFARPYSFEADTDKIVKERLGIPPSMQATQALNFDDEAASNIITENLKQIVRTQEDIPVNVPLYIVGDNIKGIAIFTAPTTDGSGKYVYTVKQVLQFDDPITLKKPIGTPFLFKHTPGILKSY